MAKTKSVCIATSGPTIDGRNIDPKWLTQAAKNYNPKTYAARGNIEHIRGVSGDKPFGMYADVLALSAKNVTLDIAGKQETRVGLYAELEISDDLIALNKAGQKLYSSIEIIPDFAGTGEAYLVGTAFTDSPAALGTDRLQFSAQRLGHFVSQAEEVALEEADKPATTTEAESFMTGLKNFITGLSAPKTEPVSAPSISQPASGGDYASLTKTMQEGFTHMHQAMQAAGQSYAAQVQKVAADLASLQTELANTEASGFTQRPPATGGNGEVQTDF